MRKTYRSSRHSRCHPPAPLAQPIVAEKRAIPSPALSNTVGQTKATHRAQIEVVGERGAHLGIRHVALDLVRVRLGLGCGLGLGLGARVGICYGALDLWHVLVQPLQQQLLPRLLRVRVRVRAGVRTKAKVGVRVEVGLRVHVGIGVKVWGHG